MEERLNEIIQLLKTQNEHLKLLTEIGVVQRDELLTSVTLLREMNLGVKGLNK